jgi:hypothetical protein
VINFDVVIAEPRNSFFFGQSAAPILDRREHCGRNVLIVCQDIRLAAQATSKKFSGLR